MSAATLTFPAPARDSCDAGGHRSADASSPGAFAASGPARAHRAEHACESVAGREGYLTYRVVRSVA